MSRTAEFTITVVFDDETCSNMEAMYAKVAAEGTDLPDPDLVRLLNMLDAIAEIFPPIVHGLKVNGTIHGVAGLPAHGKPILCQFNNGCSMVIELPAGTELVN